MFDVIAKGRLRSSGRGFQPSLARAFEPFLKTKSTGEEPVAASRRLSPGHAFIEQSGGWLEVWSEPDEGAAVELWLPRSEEADAPTPIPRRPSLGQATGKERRS